MSSSYSLTENLILCELLSAIKRKELRKIKDLCSMLAYEPFIFNNQLVDHYIEPHYGHFTGLDCLDVFSAVLYEYKNEKMIDDTLIDIFSILVSHGMQWAEERVKYDRGSKQFCDLVYITGHVDFYMYLLTILPPGKKQLDYLIRMCNGMGPGGVIKYIDVCESDHLERRLKKLDPVSKGYIFTNYILEKNFLWFIRSNTIPAVIDITKLLILRNIGEIKWCNSMDANIREVLAISERRQGEVNFHNLNYCLKILSLLISAGYSLPTDVTDTWLLGQFLLKRPHRWLMKREKVLEFPLPIPLEARLQLWSIGLGKVFTRRQMSALLQL